MAGEELDSWLRLAHTPGIGPATAQRLLQTFGLPDTLFSGASSRAELSRCCGDELAGVLRAPPSPEVAQAIERARHWLESGRPGAGAPARFLLCIADADYPRGLLDLADAPLLLYAEGRREFLAMPALAIVGSRSATRQGELNSAAFAAHLGGAGLAIVSGMARGIDAAAHRGALEARVATIAVLGTGIDLVYPAAHRDLCADIAREGLLLSEFALGAKALTDHFPRRNRLIAALARGVLVVEAAVHSGSLITARLAGELGREVFAIPGSIHSPLARGCHRLIRDGAKLVESAQDILEEPSVRAGLAPANPVPARDEDSAGEGSDAELLAALGHDPVDLDTLAARLRRGPGATAAALLQLELARRVERLPGNRYQRLG